MFVRAFITMVAADAVDRHLREQQHRAWLAQQQARAGGPAWPPAPAARPAHEPRQSQRPT